MAGGPIGWLAVLISDRIGHRVLHLWRAFSSAGITFVLLTVAAFVAHGRWRRLRIAPRH